MRYFPPITEWDIEDYELFSSLTRNGNAPHFSTGLTDKNKKEIFEGDILEFTDKWEWYRIQWWSKLPFSQGEERKRLQAEYDALPMPRRAVEMSADEGVNFSVYDLQQGRFAVIGNIYENTDLLPSS